MLGFGWTEMLVIGVVALIVIGPKELPGLMQKVGKFVGTVRRMGGEFQRELNKTTGLDEVKNLRNAITQPLKSTTDSIRKEFNAIAADGSVKPSGALKPADPKAESVVDEIHKAAGITKPAAPAKTGAVGETAPVDAAKPASVSASKPVKAATAPVKTPSASAAAATPASGAAVPDPAAPGLFDDAPAAKAPAQPKKPRAPRKTAAKKAAPENAATEVTEAPKPKKPRAPRKAATKKAAPSAAATEPKTDS